jgi:hypothetical protein
VALNSTHKTSVSNRKYLFIFTYSVQRSGYLSTPTQMLQQEPLPQQPGWIVFNPAQHLLDRLSVFAVHGIETMPALALPGRLRSVAEQITNAWRLAARPGRTASRTIGLPARCGLRFRASWLGPCGSLLLRRLADLSALAFLLFDSALRDLTGLVLVARLIARPRLTRF